MIKADQLQKLLREFSGPLSGVSVTAKSEAHEMFQPHLADITGVCNIHGKPTVYEVEDFDLRRIRCTDDVIGLAGQILESFQTADISPQFKALQTQ